MKLLAYLIYVPLQIIWLPISVIGAVWVGYKQLAISRNLGVSQTAVEIINGRWTMDVFGLRDDPAARRLAAKLPNNSVLGLWLTLFPLWVVSKVLGVPFLYPTLPDPKKANIANLVPSRTVVFDDLIEANAAATTQFVLLGAGLDTRAYNMPKPRSLTVFELDQLSDQAHKRKHLAAAEIDSSHVRFVEVDFADPDWIKALLATDYDPAQKTIFLWEGVTLYLAQQDVAATLTALRENAAAGSVVLADIYATRFVRLTQNKAVSWSLELTGEEIGFGIDFSSDAETQLKDFVEAQDLRLGRYQFLGGSHKQGPFVVIAEMLI